MNSKQLQKLEIENRWDKTKWAKKPYFHCSPSPKDAVTDMRYFARSKFSRVLVHKKFFDFI